MVMKIERGKYPRKQNRFLEWMFLEKLNPTNNLWFLPKIKSCQGDMLLSKLKEVSAGTDCEFPYGRTMLHAYLVKVGLQYQKADIKYHKVIMKSPILAA